VKNGYDEFKDNIGTPSISIIWTECSKILLQVTNWGAFSSVLDTQGKEFNKF